MIVNKKVGFVLMLVGVFFLLRYLNNRGMLGGNKTEVDSDTTNGA